MITEKKREMFAVLDQGSVFAVHKQPSLGKPFSKKVKAWCRQLSASMYTTKFRTLRNQVFEFLDVGSFAEIQNLIYNAERRQEVNARAYALIGKMFGIEGNAREVIARVDSFSKTADAVVRYLKSRVFEKYAPYIEITNEIDAITSPVDLLLIIFDDRYHKKARFEAKRKLFLMKLAASIDQRERETETKSKFVEFLDFLNKCVWSKDISIGELDVSFLVSTHEPESFACREVRQVSLAEIDRVEKKPGTKITLIKRRRFTANGRQIPIYVSIRKKPSEAKVLKLLRKGEENPAAAVDDELGLMGVVDSALEVKLFQKHLTQSAIRAGSFMTLEDISDTLEGGDYACTNQGSSSKTSMLKFFARMGGMRVEFIVHTNRSYLDYIYRRGTAHDEYEVKRIFDSGVARLLFPKDIYHLDLNRVRDELIDLFRKRIEEY